MSYLLHILIMIGIYIPLALSLNLIVGYGGLLSMCHAAFYGIGAYTTTLLMVNLHVPFYVSLIACNSRIKSITSNCFFYSQTLLIIWMK